jgi:hypothetical protein
LRPVQGVVLDTRWVVSSAKVKLAVDVQLPLVQLGGVSMYGRSNTVRA